MKLWEGLGYYSRARNLQKAAKLVAERGAFPGTYGGLLALPGIGEYTAGAIASAAFGLREPAVDGNVLRCVARLTDCHDDIAAPGTKRAVQEQVRGLMPEAEADVRIFNQAVMELGATVCVPNGPPKCDACPARDFCLGRLRGTAESLPVKAAKKARRVEEKTVFLLLRNGEIALRRRPDAGLLAGLWEFPNTEGTLDEAEAAAAVRAWGLEPKAWRRKLTAKHIFTHVEWRMTGYALETAGAGPAERYSGAADYFDWASAAILEMFRQTGPYRMEGGLLKSGVLIRHLILPGELENTRRVIDWVAETFRPGEVLFSLMSQYTPQPGAGGKLARHVTKGEYRAAADYMANCGIADGYTQERTSAREEYTPAFDMRGI